MTDDSPNITDRKSLTIRLVAAALALINDIKAMQTTDPTWFGGFSEYEIISDADGAIIEWPNLAITLKNLEGVIQEIKDQLDIERQAQIAEITSKLVGKE